MRYRNIFWGIILILLGVLFTLDNLNVIYFHASMLWRLWPVVLILWGISILPTDKWVRLSLVLVVLAGSVFYMFNHAVVWEDEAAFIHGHDWPGVHHDVDVLVDHDEDADVQSGDGTFYIATADSITDAELNMEVVAGTFILRDSTDQLMEYRQSTTGLQYKYSLQTTGTRAVINVEAEEDKTTLDSKPEARVNIALSTAPVWDVNLEVGAAAVRFDLTPFKIKKLNMESGAASLKLKLGDKYPETRINVDAGASELVLSIPEESGCDIEFTSFLSAKSLDGFEKVDYGHYRTPNFDSAQNKIYLELNAAISNYTINRY